MLLMIQAIIENIYKFFMKYAYVGIRIFVIFFLATLIYNIFFNKKRSGKEYQFIWLRSITVGLLAMYVYIVIGITILSRSEAYSDTIDLVLFHTFRNNFISRMFIYENILLFVPLGILLFILSKLFRNTWVALLTGCLCSLTIEVTQLVAHVGRFELDDILTNTMGMLFGNLTCKLVVYIYNFLKCKKE